MGTGTSHVRMSMAAPAWWSDPGVACAPSTQAAIVKSRPASSYTRSAAKAATRSSGRMHSGFQEQHQFSVSCLYCRDYTGVNFQKAGGKVPLAFGPCKIPS